MNWFYNLKISYKLISSFILVSIITLVVGFIGYNGIKEIAANQDSLYTDRLLPIEDLGNANSALLVSRGDVVAMLGTKDLSKRGKYAKSIKEQTSIVDELIEKYSKTYLVQEEKETLSKFLQAWKEYQLGRDQAIKDLLEGKDDEATQLIYGESLTHQLDARKYIKELVDINIRVAAELIKASDKSVGSAEILLLIFVVAGGLISVLLGFFISGIISKPIKKLVQASNSLAVGNINVNVESNTKDEVGELQKSFQLMIENTKAQAEVAEKISDGDLDVNINIKSENDILNKSFIKVKSTLKDLVNEALNLSKAGVEGKLNTRGNAQKFNGGYKGIVQGVNDTLDAVILPIKESASLIDKYAEGDFTTRITTTYKGDHQLIVDSLNKMGDSVSKVINQVKEAVQATASAANQISSSTEEMAAGAQEQSAQTTEIAGAVEEMTKTIFETTKTQV